MVEILQSGTLNQWSALLAFVMAVMVVRGYWPLVRFGERSWEAHSIRGIAILVCAVILRLAWWDILRMLGPGWIDIARALGGGQVNVVFNLMMAVAFFELLRGRACLIPEVARKGWHWWNAWLYPRGFTGWLRRR